MLNFACGEFFSTIALKLEEMDFPPTLDDIKHFGHEVISDIVEDFLKEKGIDFAVWIKTLGNAAFKSNIYKLECELVLTIGKVIFILIYLIHKNILITIQLFFNFFLQFLKKNKKKIFLKFSFFMCYGS